ncbi:MAG TPA: hypothetical protein VGS41_15795 [Chthonomonadales bacterium]|nr:hypothetical protein [Chthonomonadales bacterium]
MAAPDRHSEIGPDDVRVDVVLPAVFAAAGRSAAVAARDDAGLETVADCMGALTEPISRPAPDHLAGSIFAFVPD